MSARPFDGFEVRLVVERLSYSTGEHYVDWIESAEDLRDIKAEDEEHQPFYTVYGFRGFEAPGGGLYDDGGAEAIADLPTYQDAIELATALADGKPIADMTPEDLR